MCRLAAYLGEKLPLKTLLLEPEHSLYVQSWQPKELNYAKINADGFGFGWYLPDGTAVAYRNQAPIWNDSNLDTLSKTLHSPLWLAMVRSATADYGNFPLNIQPFKYGDLLFVHNGFIKDFNKGVRHAIMDELAADILDNIHGLTDSEYLFALLCQFTKTQSGHLEAALADTAEWCRQNLANRVGMFNIAVTDGNKICALRLALNEKAPTFYYNENKLSGFPENSQLIASEKLTNDADWHEIPIGHLLTLELKQVAKLTPLD